MFIEAESSMCTVRRLRPAPDRELSPRARAAAAQTGASHAGARRPRRLCWPAQGVFDRINCCFDQAACECRREGPGALSGRIALTVLMAPAHSLGAATTRGWVVLAAGSEAARSRARPLARWSACVVAGSIFSSQLRAPPRQLSSRTLGCGPHTHCARLPRVLGAWAALIVA